MRLAEALPELVSDLEAALAHLGRGDLAQQLKEASVARWSYDDFSDTTYLHLAPDAADATGLERLSLYDELGVNVDTDPSGRVCGIEVLEGKRIAARLQGGR